MWLVNCTSKEDKSTQQYFIHQGNLLWITASLWLRLFLIYCFYSVFNHKWAPYEAFTMQNWQLFLSAWKIFLDNNLWLGNILRSFNSYIIFIQCLMMQGLPIKKKKTGRERKNGIQGNLVISRICNKTQQLGCTGIQSFKMHISRELCNVFLAFLLSPLPDPSQFCLMLLNDISWEKVSREC